MKKETTKYEKTVIPAFKSQKVATVLSILLWNKNLFIPISTIMATL